MEIVDNRHRARRPSFRALIEVVGPLFLARLPRRLVGEENGQMEECLSAISAAKGGGAFWRGGDWPRFQGPHHGGFQMDDRRRAGRPSFMALIAHIDGLFLTPSIRGQLLLMGELGKSP